MMSFKKIGVINDNPNILMGFINILDEIGVSSEDFFFFCSPHTPLDKYGFIDKINIRQIDIKKHSSWFISEGFDLLISLHCKQIFPAQLVETIKCINIHPGYNPDNRGWYPQVFAIINDTVVGATIHEMDEQIDHGKIIGRKKVAFNSWDTSLSIYNRIVDAEFDLLRIHIKSILSNNYSAQESESRGTYNSLKEFKKMCEIDLDEVGDYRTLINKLRALTHGDYKNAWFWDPETGKKIYISITLEADEAQ
jgi:methionyl-tRNA formyltransferase